MRKKIIYMGPFEITINRVLFEMNEWNEVHMNYSSS